jgi:hypothetical protein
MKTLITEHWAHQLRGASPNLATRISRIDYLRGPDMRTLFERAYVAFADRCRAIEEPALAVVGVDAQTGEPAGMACLRARVDRHVTAIVGRHDRCDLYLTANPHLALRHLAVILGPVTDWRRGTSTVSYRIADLRSAEAMVDEDGRPLRALRSEGPAMLRCAGYAIFALPVGDPTDWPTSAADAWSMLPERIYHDELVRVPDASVVRPRVDMDRHQTLITRIAGPREIGMSLATGDVAGRLTVERASGTVTVNVGTQALRDGVLIGRYERCDGLGVALDDSVSRVHLLLVLVGDRLLAIDIASTNGSRIAGGNDARVIEVRHDMQLELGHSTVMRWTWSS